MVKTRAVSLGLAMTLGLFACGKTDEDTGQRGSSGSGGKAGVGGVAGQGGTSGVGGGGRGAAGAGGGGGVTGSCSACSSGQLCLEVVTPMGPSQDVSYVCTTNPCGTQVLSCSCGASACQTEAPNSICQTSENADLRCVRMGS